MRQRAGAPRARGREGGAGSDNWRDATGWASNEPGRRWLVPGIWGDAGGVCARLVVFRAWFVCAGARPSGEAGGIQLVGALYA